MEVSQSFPLPTLPPPTHIHIHTRTHTHLQVTDTLSTAEVLLGDLVGFKAFRRETAELEDELREYQKEQFDSWSRQVLAAIDNPREPLR